MATEKADFSTLLLVLEEVLYIVALTIKQTKTRRLYFFPIAALCIYITFFTSSHKALNNYSIGCHLFTRFIAASDHLLLNSNLHQLKHRTQTESIDKASFKDRLLWSLSLAGTPRGIGWSFEPTSHLAPRPKGSRRRFLLQKPLEIFLLVIIYDLAGMINRWNPCFARNGPSLQQSSWIYNIASLGFVVAAWASLRILHTMYGIVSVSLGLTQPNEWPSLYGSLTCCYSVRNTWGRFWHQNLRRPLTSHSTWITKTFELRSKSTTRSVAEVFLPFFISGLVHCAGDYMTLNSWSGGSLRFFVLQSLAIMLEGVVVCFGRKVAGDRLASTGVWKTIGYLWVAMWFSYSLPIMIDPLLRAGFFEDGISFSVILGLLQGTWSPKRS